MFRLSIYPLHRIEITHGPYVHPADEIWIMIMDRRILEHEHDKNVLKCGLYACLEYRDVAASSSAIHHTWSFHVLSRSFNRLVSVNWINANSTMGYRLVTNREHTIVRTSHVVAQEEEEFSNGFVTRSWKHP